MRILWSLHLYPPTHNCGSEWMAHNINRYLISKGHEVRVILNQADQNKVKAPYSFEGVDVYKPTSKVEQYSWGDIILTHLDYTKLAIPMAHLVHRPVIQFVHNDTAYASVLNARACNIVYNSKWISDKLSYKWHSFVFNPYCDYDYMSVNTDANKNKYITLINVNENKGGKILYDIARAMPDKLFLAVKGSYHEQVIEYVHNVAIMDNQKDIRKVYEQTRILIMPSEYESWGMTATEAMCNGIPVISTRTPGLLENCSNAGLYIDDRNNIEEWIKQINRLDNETMYNEVSEVVRDRAKQICNPTRLNDLENFIYECKKNYRFPPN